MTFLYTLDISTFISLLIQIERLNTRAGLYIEGGYIETGTGF
jgi:hypothetical protein